MRYGPESPGTQSDTNSKTHKQAFIISKYLGPSTAKVTATTPYSHDKFNLAQYRNAYKTKYMVMSREQNAGRIHSVRIDNSTFEWVEEFKYLGTTLTNQNSIAEGIKSRMRSGNACYNSVQNLLSSRFLYKNLQIKM